MGVPAVPMVCALSRLLAAAQTYKRRYTRIMSEFAPALAHTVAVYRTCSV